MRNFAIYFIALWLTIWAHNVQAEGFIDYRPTTFSERATKPFFFSIGKKLKYGDAIREDAPTLFEPKLFEGNFTYVCPSPDQKKAAVVLGNSLFLVQPEKPPIKLLQSLYVPSKNYSIGDSYYGAATGDIKWDVGSRYIFISHRTLREPINNRRESDPSNTSLVRIDTNDPVVVQELIPQNQYPNSSHSFFSINENSVCFHYANNGNMFWKCLNSGIAHSVERLEVNKITFTDGTIATPFFSYWQTEGSETWLALAGYSLIKRPNSMLVDFFHKGRPNQPIFTLEGVAETWKGHFLEGFHHNDSTVLPGDRYAFVSVWDHKLVVDSETGQYKEVPKDSRVFLNFNSNNSQGWYRVIDHHDGYLVEMGRTKQLRTNYHP